MQNTNTSSSSLKMSARLNRTAHYLTDGLRLNYTVLRFARTNFINESEYMKVRHCDVKTKWCCDTLLQSEFWKETSHTGIFSPRLCGDIWVEIITKERHVLFKHQCSMASLVLLSDLYTVPEGNILLGKTSRLGMQKLPLVTVFSPATAEHITPRNFLSVSMRRVLTTEITVVTIWTTH